MITSFFIFGLSFFLVLLNPFGWGLFYYAAPFHLPFILKNSNKILYRIHKPVFYFFLFVLYALFSYFCISHYKGAGLRVFRYVYELVVFWILLKACMPIKRIILLHKFYIFSCLGVVVKMAIQRTVLPKADGERYTIFNFIKYMDPNFLAALFILPSIFLFYQIIKKKADKLTYVVLLSFLVAVFMTGSRGALLAILLGFSLIILSIKSIKIKISFVLIVLLSLLFLVKFKSEKLNRFNIKNLQDGSNMLRFHLWYTAFRIFLSNPLFGRGANSMIILGPEFGVRINIMVHNTVLEILADYGLFGFFLWMAPFLSILRKAMKKHNSLVVSILASTFFAAFFISAQDSSFWWQNIILCSLMLKYRIDDILDFKLVGGRYFARVR